MNESTQKSDADINIGIRSNSTFARATVYDIVTFADNKNINKQEHII